MKRDDFDFPRSCLRVGCGFYDYDTGSCTCSHMEEDYACPFSESCYTLEDFYAGRLGDGGGSVG